MTTTSATAEKIARYATEHTRDCGGDRARALREMDDEPGEVARAVGCTAAEISDWIDRHGEAEVYSLEVTMTKTTATDEEIMALRTEAGAAGDLEQVEICDRALAGDAEAMAECIAVMADAEAQH